MVRVLSSLRHVHLRTSSAGRSKRNAWRSPRHVPATASGPARLDERSPRLRHGCDGSDDSDMASEPNVSGERAVDAANLCAPAPVRTPLRNQPYATTRTALIEPLALTPSPLHNQHDRVCNH